MMEQEWYGIVDVLTELYYFGKHHPGRNIKLEWFTTENQWYCELGEDCGGFGFSSNPARAIESAIQSETRRGQK